jgi:hypothetical protein
MRCFVSLLIVCCAPPHGPTPPVYTESFKCTSRPSYAMSCEASATAPKMIAGTLDGATFTPLDEQASNALLLHPGPQGGYHVFLDVQTTDVCASWVLTKARLKQPGETSVLRFQQYEQGFTSLPASGADHSGQLQFFICPSQLAGVSLAGKTLELEIAIVDCTLPEATSALVSHTYTVVPTCPEGDVTCTGDARAGCAAP